MAPRGGPGAKTQTKDAPKRTVKKVVKDPVKNPVKNPVVKTGLALDYPTEAPLTAEEQRLIYQRELNAQKASEQADFYADAVLRAGKSRHCCSQRF